MHLLDWLIVAVVLGGLLAFALWAKRFNRAVVDFMAANRCAGRYLLSVAEGMALMGAISVIANMQVFYVAGYNSQYWSLMLNAPVSVILVLSGWVIYRFRQTRALTLAQFFEIRYSRGFRIFAGSICYLSGIINFGIFPGVAARFFVYFCDLPPVISIFGIEVKTYIIVMMVLLAIALKVTFAGGQITIMVTDFLQGILMLAVFWAISILIYNKFDISTISNTILSIPEKGKSFVNPYDASKIQSFNLWFITAIIVSKFYNALGWQSTQGYNCSAISPHEARMGRILGSFRGQILWLVFMVVGAVAFAVMNNPSLSPLADKINTSLQSISGSRAYSQMVGPALIKQILPIGFTGLFCAIMFCAFLSTHDTYLHSWGTILVQDVLIPLRKKELDAEQHMKWLKRSILAVAVFIFLWSIFVDIGEYIGLYWMITGAIFLGGSGAAIIGGLYWKKGTTSAAYAAMITGAVLSVGGFTLKHTLPSFTMQVYWISMIASGVSLLVYIIVSLMSRQPDFNIDQMLHRGKYAIEGDTVKDADKPLKKWKRIFGITNEFSRWDIFIYFLVFGQTAMFALSAMFAGVWYCIAPHFGYDLTDRYWLGYWKMYLWTYFALATVYICWLFIGGLFDIKRLFAMLKIKQRSDIDDGRVVGHHNLSDEEILNIPLNGEDQ